MWKGINTQLHIFLEKNPENYSILLDSLPFYFDTHT